MKLSGSTLLETLVATILFLLIFNIAIDALVRVNKLRNADWVSMERDFNQWRDTGVPVRDTMISYPWGTIQWKIDSEEECYDLYIYTVTANMKNGQTAVYQFLRN